MNGLKLLQAVGLMNFRVHKPGFRKNVLGLKFPNRIGLGAGFDKNAQYLDRLKGLGFGFVEIGTVTPQPQVGNEQPRLFRLPQDEALINRMGFNNDGVNVIADRLSKWREKESMAANKHSVPMIIGGNIGKNKVTANEDAWKDYETCFKVLHPYVDYFVVNVSSPNTPGLRELQQKDSLRKILRHLQMINNAKSVAKPILLKISPDLRPEQLDDVIDLALEINLDGIVATNTTTSRGILVTPPGQLHQIGQGGLSGKPLQKRSTEIVRYIHDKTRGIIPIIASGGIFTANDVKEKLDAGAVLVQVWTGFIYEGPAIVKNILNKLES
jgi:dihydroorotate dehydrogenase